jgi:hypothetical protein
LPSCGTPGAELPRIREAGRGALEEFLQRLWAVVSGMQVVVE